MSHLKQRNEKTCLNCNAAINGRYCSICGQENIEPQESVWHLVVHFFNDFTHFDGKFFSSVKYVVTKPGFLSSEYVAGRRMSYLNPIRFYVFTSALFFFIMFTFFMKNNFSEKGNNIIISKKDSLRVIKKAGDLGMKKYDIDILVKKHGIDSLKRIVKRSTSDSLKNGINFSDDYRDRKQYDSLYKIGKVKEGYIDRKMIEKQFDLKDRFGKDNEKANFDLIDTGIHLLPQVLFISLPFFALILKFIYVRRKKYYYVAHIIFTIHFYIFVYILILLINSISKIAELTHQGWLYDVTIVLGFSIFLYMYLAMRNFYTQSRGKTILKMLLLSFFLFFLILFLLIVLFGITIFKM